MCRDVSRLLLLPTALVCVLFGPIIPTYNYFFVAFYICVHFLVSIIATESEGCGLVLVLGTMLYADMDFV